MVRLSTPALQPEGELRPCSRCRRETFWSLFRICVKLWLQQKHRYWSSVWQPAIEVDTEQPALMMVDGWNLEGNKRKMPPSLNRTVDAVKQTCFHQRFWQLFCFSFQHYSWLMPWFYMEIILPHEIDYMSNNTGAYLSRKLFSGLRRFLGNCWFTAENLHIDSCILHLMTYFGAGIMSKARLRGLPHGIPEGQRLWWKDWHPIFLLDAKHKCGH